MDARDNDQFETALNIQDFDVLYMDSHAQVIVSANRKMASTLFPVVSSMADMERVVPKDVSVGSSRRSLGKNISFRLRAHTRRLFGP